MKVRIKEPPKNYYLKNREIILKLKGLNFYSILVEGVISVYNASNEFVNYEKINCSLFVSRIIDYITSNKINLSEKNKNAVIYTLFSHIIICSIRK